MTGTIVTIISGMDGGLGPSVEKQSIALLKGLGLDRVDMDILHPGKAADYAVGENSAELTRILRQKFQNFGAFDIFIQDNDEYRKKRLLVADMDATMIQGETLDELAAHVGLKDKIAPITAKAMRGEIDFAEALRMRVGLLKGMPVTALYDTLKAMKYSAGAAALVKTMNRSGARCVLISGGFDIFTGAVAQTLGFHKDISNRLGIAEGKLTGEVVPPIVDKNTKKKTVEGEAKSLQLDLRATLAVGDGANDIPMLQTAGAGVGYFGKPAVQEATPFQIRHTDLTAILYMQGYAKREFAG